MQILLLNYNPLAARFALVIGGLLLIVVYLFYQSHRSRAARKPPATAPRPAAPPRKPAPAVQQKASIEVQQKPSTDAPPRILEHTVRPGAPMRREVLRAGLIVLAIFVAVGFILILVPEGAVDRMAQNWRAKRGESPQEERISLLYLGDESQGKQFHIRGVIRNISTQSIEKLDAMVRLYSQDGSLLETAVIRMSAESIAPDETSTFDLNYPDYSGQFGSYAVDFKLRQGEPVSFKDMRRGG